MRVGISKKINIILIVAMVLLDMMVVGGSFFVFRMFKFISL